MKALVLFSGGLDSSVCLGLAVKKYGPEEVLALSIYPPRNAQLYAGVFMSTGRYAVEVTATLFDSANVVLYGMQWKSEQIVEVCVWRLFVTRQPDRTAQ